MQAPQQMPSGAAGVADDERALAGEHEADREPEALRDGAVAEGRADERAGGGREREIEPAVRERAEQPAAATVGRSGDGLDRADRLGAAGGGAEDGEQGSLPVRDHGTYGDRYRAPPMDALQQVDSWPAEHVAVAVTGAREAARGDEDRVFPWASVTKIASAVAILVAAEEGIVDLDEPAGPPRATVRHLLAHTSGLPFDRGAPISRPGERRIYSNHGFDVLADLVAERAEMPFADYFASVWQTGVRLTGPAGSGAEGSLADLLEVARELLEPRRVARETLAEAVTVQYPGVRGVLPGFGRQEPNDWGLGLELRDTKAPHWTGSANSPRTYGHFGQRGTFLWVDPDAGLALACLTDRDFGDWARDAWPRFSDAVLAEARA